MSQLINCKLCFVAFTCKIDLTSEAKEIKQFVSKQPDEKPKLVSHILKLRVCVQVEVGVARF